MIKLIAFDLDNTLYDWVSYFVPAFDAMVDALLRDPDLDEARLLADLKAIHQTYRTTEYAFALSEVDALNGLEASLSAGADEHPAITTFRHEAQHRLRTYDGVESTLRRLKDEDRVLVAYTDAMATYADDRLEQLGLAELFDELVATEDHPVPETATDFLSYLPTARFAQRAIARHTPVGHSERKPSPDPLARVLSSHSVDPDEALYVGDSLSRDIAMAQALRVHDVYAEYGHDYDPALWERLVTVTHWTPEDVARDRALAAQRATPTWTIHRFPEILGVIHAVESAPRQPGPRRCERV
jgi:phosphoglycolate phosphatase-like HAD superfamily hydrolase